MISALRVLLRIAVRSLHAHKVKGAIVGGILFFGTFLLVLGTAMLDSVEHSMEMSVTESVTGHLQVYDADARDALALFGGPAFGDDIGEILDFSRVKAVLSEVPNVRAVVPMGISSAAVLTGNDFDRVLRVLHDAQRDGDGPAAHAAVLRLRTLADLMATEYEAKVAIAADPTELRQSLDRLRRVNSDAFWAEFDADPVAGTRFLDTQIAPLASAGKMLFLRAIGTDLALFTESFSRFEIVEGELVPPGKRGLMLSNRFRERFVKHFVARGFDKLTQSREAGELIADDPALQSRVAQNVRQYQQILFHLGPEDAARLEQELRAMFPSEDGDLAALVRRFLDVNDDTLEARNAFFYDVIAPMIRLYELNVGDLVTLRSATRAGYFKSVDIRVYGTFNFRGLETSDLSGLFNLMDLMTFRELYGLMSDEQRAELAQIREEVGVEHVTRDDAEDALFGGDAALESEATASGTATPQGFEEFEGVELAASARKLAEDVTYSQAEIDQGLAQHAAILLEDPERLDESMAAVEEAIAKHELGLQVVDWQSAAGLVGQFIIVVRVVLYVAITIIFLVALVIINNSMVIATMDRVPEIGTMRAMGAHRWFVVTMLLLETLVLGLGAGGLGAAAAVGVVTWLGHVGIPATSDILVFLFSGPRLYPEVGVGHVGFGLFVILVVSLVATLYPARLATAVQPIEAMRSE